MIDFFYNVINWAPWTSIQIEAVAIQVGLLLSFFYFTQARSLFYAVVYMFLIFLWLGILLCYYNIELFAGFLWVAELTILFILILFLFFFNFTGTLLQSKNFFWKFVFFLFLFFFYFDDYSTMLNLLNFSLLFEDAYSYLASTLMNDIHALFLSYYIFNSFVFFIFGFLILLTSVICISVLRASRLLVVNALGAKMRVYDFFTDLLNFEFLRKQNLFFQNLRKPVNRIVKKSSQEWYKKSQD